MHHTYRCVRCVHCVCCVCHVCCACCVRCGRCVRFQQAHVPPHSAFTLKASRYPVLAVSTKPTLLNDACLMESTNTLATVFFSAGLPISDWMETWSTWDNYPVVSVSISKAPDGADPITRPVLTLTQQPITGDSCDSVSGDGAWWIPIAVRPQVSE